MDVSTGTPRHRVRTLFAKARDRGEFLVGAAIGAGILGQAAEKGGADFVLALSAGRFRIMGAASVACMLPIRDTNHFVTQFASSEILSQLSVPVYFGASTLDPDLSVEELADEIAGLGFAGCRQFPDRRALSGPDARRARWCRHRLFQGTGPVRGSPTNVASVPWPMCAPPIRRGRRRFRVSISSCFNFGWNAGGVQGLASELSIEEAAAQSRELSRVVARENPDSFFVLEGGPIEDPDDLATICRGGAHSRLCRWIHHRPSASGGIGGRARFCASSLRRCWPACSTTRKAT